jgi:hypothetical protein
MTIKSCKECQREVSSSAPMCPNCGIRNPTRKMNKTMIFGAIILGLATFAWLKTSVYTNENQSVLYQMTNQQKPSAISAKQLLSEYQANEARADEKYKGKLLKLSGSVDSIDKDIFDNPIIWLKTDDMFSKVMVKFSSKDNTHAATLNKNDNIEIDCIGKSMVLGSPTCQKN